MPACRGWGWFLPKACGVGYPLSFRPKGREAARSGEIFLNSYLGCARNDAKGGQTNHRDPAAGGRGNPPLPFPRTPAKQTPKTSLRGAKRRGNLTPNPKSQIANRRFPLPPPAPLPTITTPKRKLRGLLSWLVARSRGSAAKPGAQMDCLKQCSGRQVGAR
jgi:hypothetical protein